MCVTDFLVADRQLRKQLIEKNDKNIFLEAGAGAGKSTLMVKRIVHQIIERHQKIEHIVAITFTEKAATELREKIHLALSEKMTELKDQSDGQALYAEIQEKKDLLFIGTIHSFCQKMIQERPIESEIPVYFQLIEEEEEYKKRQQFFLHQVQDFMDQSTEFMNLLETYNINLHKLDDLFMRKVSNQALGIQEALPTTKLQTVAHIEKAFEQAELVAETPITFQLKPIHQMTDGLSSKMLNGNDVNPYEVLGAIIQQKAIFKSTYAPMYEEVIQTIEENIALRGLVNDIDALLDETLAVDHKKNTLRKLLKKTPTFKLLAQCHELEEFAFLSKCKELYDDNIVFKQQVQKIAALASKETLLEWIAIGGTCTKKLDELLKNKQDEDSSLAQWRRKLLKEKSIKFETKFENAIADKAAVLESVSQFICYDGFEAINMMVQQLLQQWATQYIAENQTHGELTFDDLLFKTYTVLQDEECRQFFHHKYRHLYVDEVQDTDPLQMKILFLLAAKERADDWSQTALASNRLFLIGDPKQSIYRFRNADLNIYDKVKKIAQQSDNWLYEELTVNFRSQKTLTDWFNTHFEERFALESDTAIQPQYHHMQAKNDIESAAEIGVKFYEVPKEDGASLEIAHISQWINDNVGTLPIWSHSHQRPMKYSDVMIILPKMKQMSVYLKMLHKAGIPTSFSGRINIAEFKEIHRLMALTHYVANPYKATLLAAHLICCETPLPQLAQFQQFSYDELSERADFQAFVSLQQTVKNMSPISFLEYIIYEQPQLILGEATSKLEYKTAMSVLTTFLEKIRPLHFVSLRQMSKAFKDMLNDSTSLEYEMSIEHKEDAVRLMNLHKCKGLEAPVVFLAADALERSTRTTMHIERTPSADIAHYGLYEMYKQSTSVIYQPDIFAQFEAESQRHADAEALRRLYVAATRAGQLLFVGLHEKLSMKGGATYYSLYNGEAIEPLLTIELPEKSYYKIENDSSEYDQVLSINGNYSYAEVSPSTLEKIQLAPDQLNVPLLEKQDIQVAQRFKGPLWGSIVHKLFEMYFEQRRPSIEMYDQSFYKIAITKGLVQYDLTVNELAAFDIDEALGRHRNERLKQLMNVQKDSAGRDIYSELQQVLAQLMNHHQINELVQREDVSIYTEVPFQKIISREDQALYNTFSSAEKEVPLLHVSGVIDLIVQSNNKVYIIDYKTNAIAEGQTNDAFHQHLLQTYSAQMKAYYMIASELFSAEVDGIWLYSTATNQIIEYDFKK